MFAQETSAQDLAVRNAYMQIVEKHHKKPEEPTVEVELDKVADDLSEDHTAEFAAITEETDTVRASFERHFNALNKYYDDIYAAVKSGDMDLARAHLAALKGYSVKDDKHAGIHDENGHLQEDAKDALIEALTTGDFEARAKVASSTKDADLLASMAQTHMNEDAPGASDICTHIARNPATPKHVIEQLARHSDAKVAATASSMLSAGVHGSKGPTDISPKIEEAVVLQEMASIPLSGAGEVAKAFLDGKSASNKGANASTDGKAYKYYNTEIARHSDDGKSVEFNWGGFHTVSTARHMNTILHHIGKKAGLPDHSTIKLSHSQARKSGVDTVTVDKATGQAV
jgi:hypothetical protein